jgi:predicted transcriptional regulator YdeE
LGSFSPPDPSVSYEVHLQNHETSRTGEFEVFVGFEVKSPENVPVELCLKILPAGDYAVFTRRGEQIHSDEPVIDQWFAASGHQPAHTFFVQRYDARFKGLDRLAESEVDLLVPIQ